MGRQILGAALLCVVALGCRRKTEPEPVAPEPTPAPAVLPDVVAQPLPPAPTVDSWTPLLRLVPRAEVVAGIDVGRIRQSALWSEQLDRFLAESEPKMRALLEKAQPCGVNVRDLRRLVLAADPSSGNERSYVAVELPKIGETTVMDCLAKLDGKPAEWRGSSLVLEGGDARLFSQGPDHVVFAKKEWIAEVETAMGTSRAEPDPEVLFLLERVDLRAGVWMVGVVPPSASGVFAHVRQFGITFDTTLGLHIAAWIGIDAAHVESARNELQQVIDQATSMLPALGIPDAIARSISMSSVGDGLVLHVRASEADVRATIQAIERTMSPTPHQP